MYHHSNDQVFEETGKITETPYQAHFRAWKQLLSTDSQATKAIFKFWNGIVFAGISAAEVRVTEPDDEDEAEMEKAAPRA
jgi:hypothetical protein